MTNDLKGAASEAMPTATADTSTAPAHTASDLGNVPYKLLELRADIERALDMVAGAALLYRYLIFDKIPAPGDAVVVGDDHARIVHTAIDQTWKELSDILELAAELQEAVR